MQQGERAALKVGRLDIVIEVGREKGQVRAKGEKIFRSTNRHQ